MSYAIFGAGCFWCVEAIFSQVSGVSDVISGYTGGKIQNPTYEQICTGKTGHVEVCKISFNSDIISYEKLLKIFWENHDPTTPNQQGADIGTQYKSAIFYIDKKQKKIAQKYKEKLNKKNFFNKPIITEILQLTEFYKAEEYHQNYYENNKNQPYCKYVIKPKLDNFFNNKEK